MQTPQYFRRPPGDQYPAAPVADPGTVEPLFVSIRGLATMLAVSVPTLHRWKAAGKLPAPIRPGGTATVRWSISEIKAWAAAGCPDLVSWEATKRGASGGGRLVFERR
jgi:predicted DNA-binding transcriptional regulator AlpA